MYVIRDRVPKLDASNNVFTTFVPKECLFLRFIQPFESIRERREGTSEASFCSLKGALCHIVSHVKSAFGSNSHKSLSLKDIGRVERTLLLS